jgi:hypothetical protein
LATPQRNRAPPCQIAAFLERLKIRFGLAFQDAVAAWQIYRAALSRGLGREIEFLA